jgi:hypothetical protein
MEGVLITQSVSWALLDLTFFPPPAYAGRVPILINWVYNHVKLISELLESSNPRDTREASH